MVHGGFSSVNTDTCPEGFQDIVKQFNTIRCGSFSEGSNGEGSHRLDLLLFIRKTVGDTVDEISKVRLAAMVSWLEGST